VHLGFEPIHVTLFIFEEALEQLPRDVVTASRAALGEGIVHRDRGHLELHVRRQFVA